VCKRIRSGSAVPIIMLTARDTEIDKVVGLELGADDYVTKPFSMRELTARVRAVLRRGGDWDLIDAGAPIEVRGVRIDPERYEVFVRGEPVDLPPKEFTLLELLLRNAGRVLTRDLIIERVWGADYVGDTKTLDVHVKRLRGRIETDPHEPELIVTVRGVGYKFADT
jgi:two-component system response regulator RegX3